MWLELPNLWILILNVVLVPVIHLGVSWIFTQIDGRRFDPNSLLFRERSWERDGAVYQRIFRVRAWKARIPDAAPWFDGFAKGRLQERRPDYLRRFVVETCRGEAAHLVQIGCLLSTLLWNPWPWAAGLMVFYALASNLPCVILQRFTRARLRRVLR